MSTDAVMHALVSDCEIARLHAMPRSELQAIAKRIGIACRRSNADTAAAILGKLRPEALPAHEYPVPACPDDYVIRLEGRDQDEPVLVHRFNDTRVQARVDTFSEGYAMVSLWLNGKSYRVQFGALVLQAVVGPPGLNETCDHINQVRDDNRVSNLRWASAAAQRENQGPRAASSRPRPVVGIDADGQRLEFTSAENAASVICHEEAHTVKSVAAHIRKAIDGGTEAYGHAWEFAPQVGDDILEWRDIPVAIFGKETGHRVSRCGLVKERNGRITPGRVQGRYRVFKHERVHRLVAAAWVLENRDYELYVDHADRNTLNNHADNLSWVTAKENTANSVQPTCVAVRRLDASGTVLQEYPSIARATAHMAMVVGGAANMANLQIALSGNGDSAYGFAWRFVDDLRQEEADAVRARRHANKRGKAVLQIHPHTGAVVESFDKIKTAMAETLATHIGKCCHGDRCMSGGYAWRFADPANVRRVKGKTSAAVPVVLVTDGTPTPLGSVAQATRRLRDDGVNMSEATIRRGLIHPGVVHVSQATFLRRATPSEITDAGNAIKPDRTPRGSLVPVYKLNKESRARLHVNAFDSLEAAAQSLEPGATANRIKAIASKISEVVKGKRRSSHGFGWERA